MATTSFSPNQSKRLFGQSVRLIVVHTSEGDYEGTIAWIMNPNSEVSYHLLIADDGRRKRRLVPWSAKAWHAKAYNEFSDAISLAKDAVDFRANGVGERALAQVVANRLIARGLQPNWTTDPSKGGFCRHGDLQADRNDPTPSLIIWEQFRENVEYYYTLKKTGIEPKPTPKWYWQWLQWKQGEGDWEGYKPGKGPRPKAAPRFIPIWAWRKRKRFLNRRKK